MKSIYPFFALLILAAAIGLQACEENSLRIDFSQAPPPYDHSQAVRDTVLASGLHIYVIEKGSGPFEVTPNDQIQVRYTGRTESGEIFNTSYRENSPTGNTAIFRNLTPNQRAGAAPLIEGLRKGLIGMKEGEKRSIVVPPELGYQTSNRQCNASPCTFRIDPRDKTLIFDVELVNIF